MLYHQATTLFDFFPFNGVRFNKWSERIGEAAFNFVLMAPSPIGFTFHVRWLMEFGVSYYFILFGAEIATWWVPYFFGASPKWHEIYWRVQGRTITPIPRRGNNSAPNLEHLILMVLTLLTAVVTFGAYRAIPNASFAGWWIALLIGAIMVSGAAYQCSFMGRAKTRRLTI